MAKPRQLTPSCFAGGQITFNLLPDPKIKTERVQVSKPVYLDANGRETFEVTDKPFMVQSRDEQNRRLYSLPGGGETINPTSDDGETQYDPIMTQHEAVEWVEQDMAWPDGTPMVTFGSMSYRPPVLCKQKDASGNRVSYSGDPSNPISFSAEDLTQEEVASLQALFGSFMTRVSAVHELYPTPASAEAAGA